MLQVVSTGALYPPVLTTEGFLLPEHLNLQRGHFRSVSIKLSMMRVPFLKSFDCFNQCVMNPQEIKTVHSLFFSLQYMLSCQSSENVILGEKLLPRVSVALMDLTCTIGTLM